MSLNLNIIYVYGDNINHQLRSNPKLSSKACLQQINLTIYVYPSNDIYYSILGHKDYLGYKNTKHASWISILSDLLVLTKKEAKACTKLTLHQKGTWRHHWCTTGLRERLLPFLNNIVQKLLYLHEGTVSSCFHIRQWNSDRLRF